MPGWLANVVAFQVGWWAVVLAAAAGRPGVGIAVVGALLAWHLLRVKPGRHELALVGVAALAGLVFESLLQSSGWVSYAGAGMVGWIAPAWMVALWVNFATTLNVSLRPLHDRPWLAALLGAVGGPAAYLGGAQLGAMTFHDPVAGLLALAGGWALATPLLLAVAARLERMARS